MKETFKWYFTPTKEEVKKIWKTGILTIDTNVLLDLYRYHQDTRKVLLDSLNKFKGRAWISHQVADEFFRNRNRVILSSSGAFNDADRNLGEIRKSNEEPLKKLKNNRIIPDDIAENLETEINIAIEKAEKELNQIKGKFPDYIKNDPILETITDLFESSIGIPFENEILPEIIKEAKRRIENNIPPGFKDQNKEGIKPYGDYFLWRQILNYVKQTKKPLIFVTSEEKEDWWEKSSGKTVGPLYELLKEFHEETGQPFLLYRTARFLEFSSENSGGKANSEAVAEILYVAKQRQRDNPLVRFITQIRTYGDIYQASGQLVIELREPATMFTCSGRFEPQLNEIPDLNIKLTKYPIALPEHFIRSGTGTNFDFNIHLKSKESGSFLPAGQYVFEYDAITNPDNIA
jgi:hypothetical protein